MEEILIQADKAEMMTVAALTEQLSSSETGLTTSEAEQRLSQFGFNEISEKKISPVMELLSYFWGPIPWMIEVAAILSLLVRYWVDFTIIVTLLIFNAVVGFWQEYQAGNAVEALKKKLALKSRVLRDQTWQEIDARKLVPGDVIRIRLGDIVPADAKLIEGDYLSVDQSALTGESLPVSKKMGEIVYSGLAAYGFGLVTPISWGAIGLIWGYSITWAFLEDWAKLMVYRHFELETKRHQAFLNRVKQIINPQAAH